MDKKESKRDRADVAPQPDSSTTTSTTSIPPSEPQSQPQPQTQPQEAHDTSRDLAKKEDITTTTTSPVHYQPDTEIDYMSIPTELDQKFEVLDTDKSVRPTIITPGTSWKKSEQKALLGSPAERVLNAPEQVLEKNATYDLLDALTKSGVLPIDFASLHVVIAMTHCFDHTLMNTIIQDNVNPIEKVEKTSLIVAATIQGRKPEELVKEEQLSRVSQFSPELFVEGNF